MALLDSSTDDDLHSRLKGALNTSRERTPEERKARGKALRSQYPREDHAFWAPVGNRPDPVKLLVEQEKSSVVDLLPLRYERMAESAFAFYCGSARIMASDLSMTPTTGISVQLCGDARISNFGLFASPEGRAVFDISDFDETLPGPWEWDVKRLAASVEICGRDNGLSKKQRKAATRACVQSYREAMRAFAEMGNLDVWYARLNAEQLRDKLIGAGKGGAGAKSADKGQGKTRPQTSARAVQSITEIVDGELRIISDPPSITPIRDLVAGCFDKGLAEAFDEIEIERLVCDVLSEYRQSLSVDKRRLISQYRAIDIACKVVGEDNIGTRAWIVACKGVDEGDSLVLQITEAQESVLERIVGKSLYKSHGRRVVAGQHCIQAVNDMLLGCCTLSGASGERKHYYVRQFWDGEGLIDARCLSAEKLAILGRACGWTLAHAHARTGDRIAIASYMGKSNKFDSALVEFAIKYADQNEADYARFLQAFGSGELQGA